ncbi:MAG: HAD-IIIC family phosphatase [Lachnospiraceae bacterium]|jgi:FkbH-like protein|nr:HAD-IIIC family phosphatase [Lachnospiraceae bacterium]
MDITTITTDAMLRKYKSIRRELLESNTTWLEKHIAILGGSTTTDIRKMLELYLLSHGIRPVFYESEYAQYWQDAMFPPATLSAFAPDVVFIHTSNRNITQYPSPGDSAQTVDALRNAELDKFTQMWDKLANDYHCPIIQNNFEYPYFRLMGNAEASSVCGRVNFLTKLNLAFADYAQSHSGFTINDINYLSAEYGLVAWSDPFYWHMYKYALCVPAIPRFAQNIANIIKSIYGMNKKAFALDLDNTLWGGVVGDDGVENLEIGQETSAGQTYAEFQSYLKAHKKLGVILNVISKNDESNAIAGLSRPDNLLPPEEFISIKANWLPKSKNLIDMAEELAVLPESFVFVDDNPAEREIIRQQVPGVAVPEIDRPEHYIKVIDMEGYFEVTNLSEDDLNRTKMYEQNAARAKAQTTFADYEDYLLSLDMQAQIKAFEPMFLSRITQLTNKSNQFNLTTRRFAQDEIAAFAENPQYITLYGKLLDKFGDNGVVSIVIGEKVDNNLHIRLWLMSCRVLKRDMEFAMMDEFAHHAMQAGIAILYGYYYPTAKNAMVQDFYEQMGFQLQSTDGDGNKTYKLDISSGYNNKQHVIKVN